LTFIIGDVEYYLQKPLKVMKPAIMSTG
jgi:hypothetical protein